MTTKTTFSNRTHNLSSRLRQRFFLRLNQYVKMKRLTLNVDCHFMFRWVLEDCQDWLLHLCLEWRPWTASRFLLHELTMTLHLSFQSRLSAQVWQSFQFFFAPSSICLRNWTWTLPSLWRRYEERTSIRQHGWTTRLVCDTSTCPRKWC